VQYTVTNSLKTDAKNKAFLPGDRKGRPYAGDVLMMEILEPV